MLADINGGSMTNAVDDIRRKGARIQSMIADITSKREVNEQVSRADEFLGQIDILVTCAGGYNTYANFEDILEKDWDDVVNLNLKSVYLCCKAVIPHMKARKWGRIINLGSLAGRSTSSGTSPAHYASAKAAVSILTQYIAKDLGLYGITAKTLAPGTTVTQRVMNLLTPEKKKDSFAPLLWATLPNHKISPRLLSFWPVMKAVISPALPSM